MKRGFRGQGRGQYNNQGKDWFSPREMYKENSFKNDATYWHNNQQYDNYQSQNTYNFNRGAYFNYSGRPFSHYGRKKFFYNSQRHTSSNHSVYSLDSVSHSETNKRNQSADISPTQLAHCLSGFDNFKCTLIDLIDKYDYDHKVVKEIARTHDNTFEINGAEISLRPKVKVCEGHMSDNGCLSETQCGDLHICPLFLKGNCGNKNDDCFLGHSLKTTHNRKILGKHFILDFQLPTLENLFDCIFQSNNSELYNSNLKLCMNYNSDNCKDSSCPDLHICLLYLANICDIKDCPLNHSVREKRTFSLLQKSGISSNESPKEIVAALKRIPLIKQELETANSQKDSKTNEKKVVKTNSLTADKKEVVSTVWSHHFLGEVFITEICYKSVESFCPYEETGCWRLHCDRHFHWQIQENGKPWINLPNEQVFNLEEQFCDPNVTTFSLIPLDSTQIPSTSKGLLTAMRGRSTWQVDFRKMKLFLDEGNNSFTLNLRRLHTEFLRGVKMPLSCLYVWYFNDKNKKWIEYGEIDSTGKGSLQCTINSQDIEAHRRKSPKAPLPFQNKHFTYILDTVKMVQTNLQTNVVRDCRRRPKPHLDREERQASNATKGNKNFPQDWDPMKSDSRLIRVAISQTSKEFLNVTSFVQQKGGNFRILKIERIQNQFLYYAYQNKLKEMKTIYQNDKDLNIQQLFHGTKSDIVDKICDENFDWRLHGSSTGQMYGRGVYFATSPQTSYGYARDSGQGQRFMFIARVVVGSLTTGNPSIVRPPLNPLTNALYDSTCDDVSNPDIIVKYDKQEYYPEYLLTIQ